MLSETFLYNHSEKKIDSQILSLSTSLRSFWHILVCSRLSPPCCGTRICENSCNFVSLIFLLYELAVLNKNVRILKKRLFRTVF